MKQEEINKLVDHAIDSLMPEAKQIVQNAPNPPSTQDNYAYYMMVISKVVETSGMIIAKPLVLALFQVGNVRGISAAINILGW